ncbi:bifunctional 2',3'-cyclic-nucleotide 2'-phosphodiesterase/3'-nucleotidase [Paenibacillus guangzhouensis]|uniref:bifunctional 2',3'-cyclic-nucleotide 2'-phosphodiesterase/3'-nucleotidase n=1 Tax=Paenibacillus guangzhouensis TaxID=1473112 RepID=UPI001266DA71|nr:bifunctional 2',3'-cyclic-nucleotide 2'-phosphodiesterase/3'-nucleotidase [Paenibacillus guangzhouensis]
MNHKKMLKSLLAAALVSSAFSMSAFAEASDPGAKLKLRLMETTDIHTHIVNHDYYQDQSTEEFGLALTASLIMKARQEVTNSMLIDNGDLIQGNPLGDFVAKVRPLQEGQVHPVFKAQNLLEYDAAGIGNHEFNFGLEFLDRSLKGAKFPHVNANVYIDDHDNNPDNDKNYFKPYEILTRTFKDDKDAPVTLKIGVIGFVPPQIMEWDKANLEGKVIAKDIIETANKFVPKMKQEGADLIIAVPHSGFDSSPYKENMSDATVHLAKVPGIDAILFGHDHKVFPSKEFDNIEGIDIQKGTIHGVAAVMPGFWGDHLGVVDLTLEKKDGKWKVVDSQSEARPIYDKANKKSLAKVDERIVDAVKEEHAATVEFVRGPIGETTAPINSFFAVVHDDPSVQIVSNAQKWYTEKYIQGTSFEGIPVLSAAAPFKAGGRWGPNYFTDIPTGTLAVKSAADLYVYPNTVNVVQLNGDQVREWLEHAAGQFNQIDPSKKDEQPLINEDFPTYLYDVIDGVTYQIDVTKPARYDRKGKLVNPDSHRIVNLQFNGKPVTKDQQFLVATNNYRASGGGNFPNLDGSNIVISSPDETRQVLIDYIAQNKKINPTADNNWSFIPVTGDTNITFRTSPKAKDAATKLGGMKYVGEEKDGFAKFTLDLSKGAQPETTPMTDPSPVTSELVPVRETAGAHGITVAYDLKTKTVTLTHGAAIVSYVLNTDSALVNGTKVPVSAELKDNTLWLPASILQSLTS